MVSRLSDSITDFYISRKIIEPDYKDVYKFGVELILNDIITFSLIILISSLLFKFRYSPEFLVVFCSVRIYCGGYHAPKAYICRLTMLATFMLVVLGCRWLVNMPDIFVYLLLFISFISILPIIPVEHPNKTMTEDIRKKGKRNGTILYAVYMICSIVFLNFICREDGMMICLSLSAVSVLAIIGKIFNGKEV